MKQEFSDEPAAKIPDARVIILQSKWYSEYTDAMVAACKRVLKLAECPDPITHVLPGSLEIPLAAKHLLKRQPADAVICFGAIMKGETYHFEMIVDECVRGLGRVMYEFDTPIIVEIIPITNIEQLVARSAEDQFNKGIEAAHATIEIIDWRRRLTDTPRSE